jgi:hypothetical protein
MKKYIIPSMEERKLILHRTYMLTGSGDNLDLGDGGGAGAGGISEGDVKERINKEGWSEDGLW